MDSGRKRRSILLVAGIALVVVTGAYTAAEVYRSRDYLSHFTALKGRLVSQGEKLLEASSDYRLQLVTLRDDKGLEVVGLLRIPSAGGGPFPAILALGGLRTGKHVMDFVGETPGVAILALDYPYSGKKSNLGAWEFARQLPAIRRALMRTVPAASLAVDYLREHPEIDGERITLVGGSIGALFGPAIGAADDRIAAVALLFGAADLPSLIRANVKAPAPLAAAAGYAGGLLVSPLEPRKYVGRISPRPLFMLNGTGDPRMPGRTSRLLHEAAGEPKTVRWIDAGHVNVRSTAFRQQVRHELMTWLLAHDLIRPHPQLSH